MSSSFEVPGFEGFTDRQIRELVDLVRRRYPAWDGFDHPPFVADEIEYKQETAGKAAVMLGRSELESLLAGEAYDEILSRIEQLAKATNLLYLRTPKSSDLALLYHPHLQKEPFCREFFALLYGDGETPQRLERYVEFVGRHSLPNRWPFPTYFLFLSGPETEFFVKPQAARWFLQLRGQGALLESLPSAAAYAAIRENAQALKEAMGEYNPQSMIDIQSFVWVCHRESQARVGRLTPEAQIELDVPLTTYTYQPTGQYLYESDEEEYMAEVEVPTFDTLMNPLLQALKSLGGSAKIDELNEKTIEIANLTEAQTGILHQPDKSDLTEIAYRLGWTRTYLKNFGLLENPARGVWALTAAGNEIGIVDEIEVKRTVREEYYADTSRSVKEESQTYGSAPDNYFSLATFELLAELSDNPTNNFYQSKKEAFTKELEQPFKQLMKDVAAQLPAEIKERMETGKRLFSLIPKNDYGQGGAWNFYWGAFYQKGGKRTASAQLSMWINEEVLEFGFYIGDYGTKQRERFIRNCQEYYEVLLPIFELLFADDRILYGARETWSAGTDDTFSGKFSLPEFLKNPAQANFDVSLVLSRNNVLELDGAALRDLVLTTYSQVFPLVLLALEDEPMPPIREFLDLADVLDEIEPEAGPELTPAYSLSQLSAETGHDESELSRWIQAVERKGQAVLYGPPGTGKTYLAERLARHLTAESDGFTELVQFHPAYAYEDFIQGIRPQSGDDGRLTYPMKAGRFLDFCQRAANRDGRCVLIIDEINRANLSRVFGELMYLLEYRERRIPLSGGGSFRIPGNVRLIGTMNTADRSIALVDHALRRRFAFIRLAPNYDILRHYHQDTGFPIERLIPILTRLNNHINDPHYEIGHTFFLHENLAAELPDIWQMEIEPYLEEYFFDRPQAVETFRWENIKQEVS